MNYDVVEVDADADVGVGVAVGVVERPCISEKTKIEKKI